MLLNINEYFENERKRREEGKKDLVKYTYERFKALDVPVELNENGLFLNGDRVVPISTEVFTLPDKYGNAKFIIDSVYSSYHFMGQRVW